MPTSDATPLAVIRSLVYNHKPYLRDCLEGFVMQQTDFPFVAVVHDDCSTDGSADIIREYAEKYPHIIKPVFETENQYSKGNGILARIMAEACGKYGAKYYALCEGDDYWTDPHKLQKQVGYLETHPECSMVSCNCVVKMPDRELRTHEDFVQAGWAHCNEERDLTTAEIIEEYGRMAHTTGLVYRCELPGMVPKKAQKCSNGDYKLQLTAALAGKIHHFSDTMCVYRFMIPGSWNERYKSMGGSARLIPYIGSFIHMLDVFDEVSQGKFQKHFRSAQERFILGQVGNFPSDAKSILKTFGYILHYGRVFGYRPLTQGLFHRLLLRLCFYPYYPYYGNDLFINPAVSTHYADHGAHIALSAFSRELVRIPKRK